MAGEVVRYALTLEGRQFLQELGKARRDARDAARQIKDGGEEAGGGLKALGDQMKDTQRLGQGFAAAQMALSQALAGNFVAAATNAAKAMSALTATMLSNPILLVVAALAALGVGLYNAAKAHEEYRQRCADARKENDEFLASLDKMANGGPLQQAEEKFKGWLEKGNMRRINGTMRGLDERVDVARRQAELAASNLLEAETAKKPDEALIAELKAKRDAAAEEYKLQLDIVEKYRTMYADWKKDQDDAVEKQKQAAKELMEANADETRRRMKAGAEGDVDKMTALLVRMQDYAQKTWGDEEDYEKRLQWGTATKEEMEARREIDDWAKKISDTAAQQKRDDDLKAQRDTAAAEAKAAKEASDASRLARSRESAMVRGGDVKGLVTEANRLQKEADEKYGKWTMDRYGTATQEELDTRENIDRMRKEAKTIVDNRKRAADKEAKDAEKDKAKEKPWVEGVVAARGMSLGDVFNNMRGMNGAKVRDPNLDANQTTAANTGRIANAFERFNQTMSGTGVQ